MIVLMTPPVADESKRSKTHMQGVVNVVGKLAEKYDLPVIDNYNNCGITMTKVMNADGLREYTVLVHHQYLDADNQEQMNDVYEVLMAVETDDTNMTVKYTIF